MGSLFLIPVDVECTAGYKAEESPRIVHGIEGPITIEAIIDRWYQGSQDPTVRTAEYFKVQGNDNKIYLLKHDCEKDAWFLYERSEPGR